MFSVPLGYVGVLLLADSEVDHCVPFLQGGGGGCCVFAVLLFGAFGYGRPWVPPTVCAVLR